MEYSILKQHIILKNNERKNLITNLGTANLKSYFTKNVVIDNTINNNKNKKNKDFTN